VRRCRPTTRTCERLLLLSLIRVHLGRPRRTRFRRLSGTCRPCLARAREPPMGRCGSGGVGKFVRRTGLARNSAPPGLVHLPCHRRAAAWPFPGRSFFTRISRFGHVRRLPRRLASTVLEGALEFVHDDMTTRGKLRRQGPQRRKRRPAHGGAHQVAEAHNDRVTCSSGRFAPRR
jgi:hypothetical protein